VSPGRTLGDVEEAIATVVDAMDDRFVSATLSGARAGTTPPARRVTVRPVELKAGRRFQFSAFDGVSTDVTNLTADDARERVASLLDAGFANAYVRTLDGDLQLSHSRRGRPLLARHRPTATSIEAAHDRTKVRFVEESAPFLRLTGITDTEGRVKPTARAKFRQVERFVEILAHALDDAAPTPAPGQPFVATDLGCGAGVLTLATYHYLTVVRGLDVTMTGVDTKTDVVARLRGTVDALGWDGLRLEVGTIADHVPTTPPDLVVALHACDTATDDALARAIEWGARFVLAAPCCQHDLQAQLDRDVAPAGHAPLLRHGIVRERLGDLLTDSLRAEVLRAHGYRADVIEFVSTEHTAKNLMIRAIRTGRADEAAGRAAAALAEVWGVEPALARRVGYAPTA
jgi:SAM-dependent methyltransferase